MELSELKTKIIESFAGSAKDLEEVLQMVEDDQSIFPFNEYEHLICNLIEKGGLSYEQYIDIRTEYISANPNLWIFEISAPRGFGEKFAQTYVQGKCSKLQNPNKKLDPNYSGDYDLWLDGIKIEVKASRAVDNEPSRWAKFVENGNCWHGYPADRTKSQDRPETRVLQEWKNASYISKSEMNKIQQQKL